MPLISFSIPEQIPKLLDGSKRQTTRLERKTPIEVGDILYCYYKPRMKKLSCNNCIGYDYEDQDCTKGVGCPYWHNYFGEAEVVHVRPFSIYQGLLDKWAIADGFESIDEAMMWLDKTHKGWMDKINEIVVIIFEPRWTHEA